MALETEGEGVRTMSGCSEFYSKVNITMTPGNSELRIKWTYEDKLAMSVSEEMMTRCNRKKAFHSFRFS